MKQTKLQAIIFDFDGVILDTETMLFASWHNLYREHGIEFSLERWAANVGGYQYDVFDPLTHLEEQLGHPIDRDAVNAARRAWYQEHVNQLGPMPGIPDALETARQLGLRLAVASSSTTSWVQKHLTRLNLKNYFEVISCGDEVSTVKPHPEVYFLTLSRLGVNPNCVFAIEDSPKGIAAARAASIYCVAVPNPVTQASSLKGYNRLIENFVVMPFTQLLSETEEALSHAF